MPVNPSRTKLFQQKPLQVEARQWTGDFRNDADMKKLWSFCPVAYIAGVSVWKRLKVRSSEGNVEVNQGDWIARHADGRFTVWTDADFRASYDEV